MSLSPHESDSPHPDDVDWTEVSDASLYSAAQNGIPQAVAEAKRRGLEILDL